MASGNFDSSDESDTLQERTRVVWRIALSPLVQDVGTVIAVVVGFYAAFRHGDEQ
jgi:hypothetical protein